ncbi:hypothetical protein BRC81_15860 [Halobacteriales archaeon QS_1_68_20]|nr:MAG: hypothetical protein BRC81_15860 [Halobacteriales archaeon QS_1_68_20]
MVSDDSIDRGAGRDEEFRLRLQELKAQGSALLVVGDVPWDVWVDACEQLLGEGDELPRQRLLAFTNGSRSIRSRLADHHTGGLGSTTAITTGLARSASARAPVHPEVPVIDLEYDSLTELGGAISGWIQETDARHGPLSPGELRLCVDALGPLLDVHGEAAVFDFLTLTAARARAADGMAHYHLSVDRHTEVVADLLPTVDALIELGIGADGPRQRWVLDGGDVESPWLPL